MPNATLRTELTPSGIATITLNRPAVHNAFNEAMIGELTAELARAGADGQVRVVVLAGEGRSFCAGADLDWMRRTAAYSRGENLQDALKLAEMLRLLNTLPKPVVAAVHGAVFGGGVGLVACCDVAIASDNAVFAFSEVRLGLIPAAISPYVIAAIGERQARRYFLTAERFSADEALRVGLVHLVVAQQSLSEAVDTIASELLGGGPGALREAKGLIRTVSRRLDDESLPAETAQRIAEIRTGDEARERVNSFLDKHRPGPKEKSNDV